MKFHHLVAYSACAVVLTIVQPLAAAPNKHAKARTTVEQAPAAAALDAADNTPPPEFGAGKGDNAVQDFKRAGATASQAVKEMRDASFDARDIGACLRIYGVATADQVAITLRPAGFDAGQLAIFLKDTWRASPTTIMSALSKVGWSDAEIAAALHKSKLEAPELIAALSKRGAQGAEIA